MAEKMLNSFDIQDSIADDDIVLGYDKSENKVKNFKFGTGIWNWIVDKMTNAVVSKLTTTDKTILGALNELNSKGKTAYITKPDNINIHVISDSVATYLECVYKPEGLKESCYSRLVFYVNGEIAVQSLYNGKWKTTKLITQ